MTWVKWKLVSVHSVRRTYRGHKKSFWTHLITLLGDVDQGETRFGLFEDSVNLDAR
jgi:hypothetical protein